MRDGSEKRDWESVLAVFVDLHPGPSGASTPEKWLRRMANYGFTNQQREYSSFLLSR